MIVAVNVGSILLNPACVEPSPPNLWDTLTDTARRVGGARHTRSQTHATFTYTKRTNATAMTRLRPDESAEWASGAPRSARALTRIPQQPLLVLYYGGIICHIFGFPFAWAHTLRHPTTQPPGPLLYS